MPQIETDGTNNDDERLARPSRNTLTLFESYWAVGEGTTTIGDRVGINPRAVTGLMRDRGIPTRAVDDANRLFNGNTSLDRLRWKYLTPFQHALARELQNDHHEQMRAGGDDE